MSIRIVLAAVALAIPGSALAQTAPAEPAVLNNPNPDTLQVYGMPGDAKPKPIKDGKVQFGKAIRVDAPGGGDAWAIGANSPLTQPVKKGDKIMLAFYARLEKGAGPTSGITGQVQLSSAPYTALFGKSFDVTPEWKLYSVAGHADRDYAKGELAAALHLNVAKHVLDIGAVAVLNYGPKP
ncbi:MAG: hypothetical protein EOP59_04825 [Sphingomonadales bacterium]|nr:MAG: hypothetical protein EOP59_04825 [Sphingomonadales bacterium]